MPDARQSEFPIRPLPLLCLLMVIAVISQAGASESSEQNSSTAIAQRVVSSLPKTQGGSANIIASLDLTRPFETPTQWTFAVALLPVSHIDRADEQPVHDGALARCFVDELASHCRYTIPKNDSDWFSTPVEFYAAKVVFAGPDNTRPLLLMKTGSAHGGNGSHAIYTEVFSYIRQSNTFQSVFSNATGSNNNQETRFIEEGPLRGDIIVADPTSSAPFGFWIAVYARNAKDEFSRSLRYRSATVYGDGNHSAVIDSEMPGILRRMGLWRPGDPLPAPPGCSHPVLRHGQEWCQ